MGRNFALFSGSIAAFFLVASITLGDAIAPVLKRVGEQQVPFAAPTQTRVDLPTFDSAGRLLWNLDPIGKPMSPPCDSEGALPVRTTVMARPRVDQQVCPASPAATELIGLDESGALLWRRPLAFQSDRQSLRRWLIGATPEGLVLSTLEVWSPITGETLIQPRTHLVGTPSRPVPDYDEAGPGAYNPAREEILIFKADVTLIRRRGGLYRFDPASGERELLRSVAATPLGTYQHPESLAVDPSGRFVFLARRSTARGPSDVSLAVFDLDRRRYVATEHNGRGHACQEPKVIVANNQVGLSYRDLHEAAHVLVHYRFAPSRLR